MLLACLALLLAIPAQTQVYAGSITGLVQDPSGAVVPNASVVLTDADKGVQYSAVTDSAGRYLLRALPPSTYNIRIQAHGFQSEVQHGIVLVVNQNLTLNVGLRVGAAGETVEVTGQAPVLATEDAVTGQNLDRKVINDLPLIGRSVFDLALLTPGVTQPAGNTFGPNTMANNFISDGGRNAQADVLIDGVSTVGVEQNTAIVNPLYTPSVDAVQEFKVQQSNFSAEVGFTAGTVVNAVTRSGTNNFHGSAYEFLRNDVFNANNYFNDQAGIPIAPVRWNDFGATIGGPIIKNRTFFFFDYEGARQSISVTKNAGVPSTLERTGDFGELCSYAGGTFDSTGLCSAGSGQLWDPYTANGDLTNGGARQNFIPFNNMATYTSPGNPTIAALHPIPNGPGNVIDPVAFKMIQLYPSPNLNVGTGAYNPFNNWVGTGADKSRNDQFDIKIDHRFSNATQLSGKFSYQSGRYQPANLFKNVGDAYSSGLSTGSAKLLALNFTHTFSPKTLLTVSLGLTRAFSFDHGGSAADFPDQVKGLGLPSYFVTSNNGIQAAPSITINNYSMEGGNNSIGTQAWTYLKYAQETHHLIGTLAHTTGRHDLKFGAEGRLHRVDIYFPGIPGGTYAYDANSTSQSLWDGSGDAMASFMTGIGAPGGDVWGAYEIDYAPAGENWNIGSFVQDNWRTTDKLTLNIGMRYDLDLPRTERSNRMSWLDLNSPSPLQVPGLGPLKGGLQFATPNDRSPFYKNYHGFGPRFGFAYKVRPTTVVRGGYGIYYTQNKGAAAGTGISDQGFVEQTNWLTSYLSGNSAPWGFLSDPFPPHPRPTTGSSNGLLTDVGFALTGPIRSWNARPYEQTWSFGIQHELPGRIVVEGNYVGKKGTHLYFGNAGTIDILSPGQAAAFAQNPSYYRDPVPNPFAGIITDPNSGLYGFPCPSTISAPSCLQRVTLMTPYPQFAGITATDPPWASSTYHALQLRAEKQFDKGLQFLATYTNSKSIDDSSVGGGGLTWLGGSLNNVLPNPWDHGSERSLSQFDISQVLQFSYIYELPIGRGKKLGGNMSPLLDAVIGGWQTNGIWRFDTGQPIILSLSSSDNTPIPTFGAQRPDLLGPLKRAPGLNLTQYFANPDVAAIPAPYTFGTAPKVLPNVRAPGTRTGALSLFKEFKLAALREGARLEFRAEAFNALNHPQFAPPNSTVDGGQFGLITQQANSTREMQLALKLYW
jgi:hypothetical protein